MLDKLAENRTPILLAEIGAYLHLIGRYSEKFVYAQAKDATEQEKEFVKKDQFKKVCDDPAFFENTGLDTLLKDSSWNTLINAFKNLNNAGELSSHKTESFCDFIEKHTWDRHKPKPEGICKILADAHGIVSGIDKALVGRGESGKQRKAYTFKATAFGYEKEIELVKKSELKKILFQKIKEILDNIKNKQEISYEDYLKFVSTKKEYYPRTIGETRRPINEISLYDYAHTIASLMKSSLAKMVIDGWQDPLTKDSNKRLKWRILKVNVDVVGLLSKGLKIGDILGYRSEIEKTYDEIKKIIEFEYPLGNEIYRDSTGIYFSCPDVDINKLKSEIIDKLKDLNKLDFSLQIEISEKSSRSMVILASERRESSKRISYPHIGDTENLEREFEESQSAGGEDICPICRIRLKPERDNRCEKCKERYEKRAKTWLRWLDGDNEDRAPKETIWLDEVADKNDCVALIVGQFDLRKWLSGEFVDTFASQTFEEWKGDLSRRNHNFLENNRRVRNIKDFEKYLQDLLDGRITLQRRDLEILNSLIHLPDEVRTNNQLDVSKFDINEHFWNPIAERDATGKALTLTDNSERVKHLIKLLFRKHPSPARIYRVWKTTQEFISETIFEKILKEYGWNSEPRKHRIQFKIEPNPRIPEGSTCDIDVDSVRFSPVCIDSQNGVFVSTVNLEILKKFGNSVKEIAENLNEKRIRVKCDKDRSWKDKKSEKPFRIVEARPADKKFQNYLPYVKIYDFPDQFMVLVPAYEALDIAERILNEYEIQFSKVRDRLPLHLGIIAFHRRTPLYVVMDAGKRLIEAFKERIKTEMAQVVSVKHMEDESLGKSKELSIKAESYSSIQPTWKISYSTGDPEQEDFWHSYIREENDVSDRNLRFDYTGSGDYVVHVKEIKENDTIKIESSYFRLFYLENAVDRFRIDEDLKPLDYIHHLKELWKKIEEKLKSKAWSVSQIYAYWEEVRKRRNYYDEKNFKKFVESALVNILEIKPKKDKESEELFNLFYQSTMNESLDLCLYWNFQVRKVKVIEGGIEK